MKKTLNYKQKDFCHEYIIDWKRNRAYKAAYKVTKDSVARANASRLLTNANILEYIEEIKNDFEKNTGITKTRQLLELAKIAYCSIAHLHETWIKLKDYQQLTPDQLAAIESTETETITKVIDEDLYEVVKIKIKLYPKLTAIAEINKMMGYNSTEKIEVTQKEDTRGKSTDELKERLEVLRQLKKANDRNDRNIN